MCVSKFGYFSVSSYSNSSFGSLQLVTLNYVQKWLSKMKWLLLSTKLMEIFSLILEQAASGYVGKLLRLVKYLTCFPCV